jgi:hypothetical protein
MASMNVMRAKRFWALGALLAISLTTTGCSICCNPYVDDYVTFGSRTPRTDMKHGRVGSIFSDPQLVGTSYEVPPNGEIIIEQGTVDDGVIQEQNSIQLGSVE